MNLNAISKIPDVYTCDDVSQYSANFKPQDDKIHQRVFYAGNNIKSMHLSVKASLKKLRTDYIDLFYLHIWDWTTSIEEIMQGLHNLVTSGKVLYLVSPSHIPPT